MSQGSNQVVGALISLGPCCACGEQSDNVRNVVMLPMRAPIAGHGWGCVQCGLPNDGATAAVCDRCREEDRPIQWVWLGYPNEGRIAVVDLSDEPFAHDVSKHPEERWR